MFHDDPSFDGPSLLRVGDTLIAAARERPSVGLALARDRDPGPDGATRRWFVGTRIARDMESPEPLRFEGDAPPLAALALRMEAGEFHSWFDDVKQGVDSGALQPLRARATEYATAQSTPPPVARVAFEAAEPGPVLRTRHARR